MYDIITKYVLKRKTYYFLTKTNNPFSTLDYDICDNN